jgi:hypothetical protein
MISSFNGLKQAIALSYFLFNSHSGHSQKCKKEMGRAETE